MRRRNPRRPFADQVRYVLQLEEFNDAMSPQLRVTMSPSEMSDADLDKMLRDALEWVEWEEDREILSTSLSHSDFEKVKEYMDRGDAILNEIGSRPHLAIVEEVIEDPRGGVHTVTRLAGIRPRNLGLRRRNPTVDRSERNPVALAINERNRGMGRRRNNPRWPGWPEPGPPRWKIGPHATVTGNAQVSGAAQVIGEAEVTERAEVYGYADVSGNARVYGTAKVSHTAEVYGNAHVYGTAYVSDNAEVSGNAHVYGKAYVYDTADVFGDARVFGDANVFGDARVFGDAKVYDSAKVSGDARVYGDAKIGGTAIITGGEWDGSEGEVLSGTWSKYGVPPKGLVTFSDHIEVFGVTLPGKKNNPRRRRLKRYY